MQNPRLQTQKSTAPTELTPRTRADAGSSLSGLVRSTPKYWIGSAALILGHRRRRVVDHARLQHQLGKVSHWGSGPL